MKNIVFRMKVLSLEALILLEGLVWDVLEWVRAIRSNLTYHMHCEYRNVINKTLNTHQQEGVAEIIEK